MKKALYVDVETTGLDPNCHELIQIAGIIEIDGKVVEKFNLKCRPTPACDINEQALEVVGKTKEELDLEQDNEELFEILIGVFNKHINKYDREDKFIICGYNVGFDIAFIDALFKRNNNSFLFSYIGEKKDPFEVIKYLKAMGKIEVKNAKLESVCEYFNIKTDNLHDAEEDIRATRMVIEEVDKFLNKTTI